VLIDPAAALPPSNATCHQACPNRAPGSNFVARRGGNPGGSSGGENWVNLWERRRQICPVIL
jgi:hypothetical protein